MTVPPDAINCLMVAFARYANRIWFSGGARLVMDGRSQSVRKSRILSATLLGSNPYDTNCNSLRSRSSSDGGFQGVLGRGGF